MFLKEYSAQDACGLAELIRTKQVSAQDVRACAIDALMKVQPYLNCAVQLWTAEPDGAASDPSGPLYGAPYLIKDIGAHFAGAKQEFGSRLCDGYQPSSESFLARALREGGLTPVGRSTTPEFGYNTSTETVAVGVTRNPWNTEFTAGGSSGGAAAAVASRAVPLAHGSDAGGSIRIPAAYCGLVGLKPPRGRVSLGPDMGEALHGLAVEHVLTRSLRDSAAVLDITGRAMPGDPFVIARETTRFQAHLKRPMRAMRVGLVTKSWTGGWPTDNECVAAARNAAAMMQATGCDVDETILDVSAEEFLLATARVWCGQLATWIDRFIVATGRDPQSHLEPAILASYRYGKELAATQLFDALDSFNVICRRVGELFQRFDVLVTPATGQVAPRIGVLSPQLYGDSALDWTRHLFGPVPYSATFNVTGQPAITLPLAMHSTGLPIGVQFVGPFGQEGLLFEIGAWFETATPWHARRALISADALGCVHRSMTDAIPE